MHTNVSPLCFRGCGIISDYKHAWWSCPIVANFWQTIVKMASLILKVSLKCCPQYTLLNYPYPRLSKEANYLLLQLWAAARWVIALNWISPTLSITQYVT
ncbi:hypothetical protein XELAEV_18023951mg [Xenopus laevis]|uniref:Uncharacterized protein n=1 Tax=Xenopus laevis TaxID=8355 RepID=A0A974D6Z6_XENLA|nr:hypothetical protein XELAEV_18023951mg [Xenopus laevis]